MAVLQNSEILEIRTGDLCAVVIDRPPLFDAEKIFDCGQSFRFDPVKNTAHQAEFAGVAHGKYISVAQDEDKIYIYNSNTEDFNNIWKRFLALDRDYEEINSDILSLSDNSALKDAVDRSSGIRILRQESWETICSFIISQNNNIPRIKKLVAALCQRCGEPADISLMGDHIADSHRENEGNFYSFPSPDRVAALGIDGLAALKTGFRAKYIFDAAERMVNGEIDLNLLEFSHSTEECIEHLCRVKGIGIKVASCALLFGFARIDAFPVDVWIKKVMAKYFSEDFSPDKLGRFAGVAQQYLFYYERYLVSGKEQE